MELSSVNKIALFSSLCTFNVWLESNRVSVGPRECDSQYNDQVINFKADSLGIFSVLFFRLYILFRGF